MFQLIVLSGVEVVTDSFQDVQAVVSCQSSLLITMSKQTKSLSRWKEAQ